MQAYEGYTGDNTEVSCEIDDENAVVAVGDRRIVFVLNPDFSDDAKKLFEALCNVRSIHIEAEEGQ